MSRTSSVLVTEGNTQSLRAGQNTTSNPDYDIVCIGFGSSSISLAIALQESSPRSNVLFLEQQPRSTYVPFTRLPGTFMQLSFLNDLITLENPRSRFSYIQYLHSTQQLIQFTNLSSIQPLREQFSRYLSWCADHFESEVQYGSKVKEVKPVRRAGSQVDVWGINYIEVESGSAKSIMAKHVVCAVGLQPSMPVLLKSPDVSSSVFHSSECLEFLSDIAKDLASEYHFAVVGDGQEAAEIVERVCGMRKSHQVTWIQQNSSGELNEIDPALSHRLYELHYTQQVREPNSQQWLFQKHLNGDLKSVHRNSDGRVHLAHAVSDPSFGGTGTVCDFIIAATGYKKLEYKRVLMPVKELFHGDQFSIDKYGCVNFKPGNVQKDCAIWVLGSVVSATNVSSVTAKVVLSSLT